MFIYLALIRCGLTNPYDLLFRELEREKAMLRETQRHLSLIVDTVPALIWQKDHDGTYLQVNQTFCKTLGISQDHILGKTDHDIFPRKIADKFRELDLEVLRTGTEQMGMEEQYASISGVHGWRLTDRMIFRNHNNSPAGIIGFAKDITQHKTAVLKAGEQQEQLLQAAKMTALGTLVAGMAHEVNNPNNFIMLNSPLLEKSWHDAVPVLEAHQKRHPEFTLAGIPFLQMREYVTELFPELTKAANESNALCPS